MHRAGRFVRGRKVVEADEYESGNRHRMFRGRLQALDVHRPSACLNDHPRLLGTLGRRDEALGAEHPRHEVGQGRVQTIGVDGVRARNESGHEPAGVVVGIVGTRVKKSGLGMQFRTADLRRLVSVKIPSRRRL